MFKLFRKPRWTAVAAKDVHAGDIVAKMLIVGSVEYVGHERIQDHDYVELAVDITTESDTERRIATIKVLPDTLIRVLQQ